MLPICSPETSGLLLCKLVINFCPRPYSFIFPIYFLEGQKVDLSVHNNYSATAYVQPVLIITAKRINEINKKETPKINL